MLPAKKFKKAKKKFVMERVTVWKLRTNKYHTLRTELEMEPNRSRISGIKNKTFYTFRKIRDMGFVNGFWKARKLARKSVDKYTGKKRYIFFYYTIKDLEI